MNTANAPTPIIDALSESLELIPLHLIRVSGLIIQGLRRQRFTPEGILELAASIKALGVQQPIVVRPIVCADPAARYEIVCGERRFLAADRASLPHIPAVIRELDDTAALEVLMSENLGRADMHALEEGYGFRELMRARQLDAEAVGAMFGKSRSYVYGRTKLLDLCADARTALQAGRLDASKALLIARLPAEKAQQAALKAALETNWKGDPTPYRDLFDTVRRKHLESLAAVPWALDDATLVDKHRGALPACRACPYCSDNDPELLGADATASTPPVCADAGCHADKTNVAHARRRVEFVAAGIKIIDGDAAKKILPARDKIVGHLDLDETCEQDRYPEPEPQPAKGETEDTPAYVARWEAWDRAGDDWPGRTYRVLLADANLPVVHVEDPKTKRVRELVPLKPARDYLAKTHGIALPGYIGKAPAKGSTPADRAAEAATYQEKLRQQREREDAERDYRAALLKAIADKCHGPLTRDDLIDVADKLLDRNIEPLKAIYGKTPEPADLKPAELPRLIRLALLLPVVIWAGNNPKPLLAAAKRWKVDAAKVKKQLAAAAKGTPAGEGKPAPTKPRPRK